jgi:hypothetical protein
MYLYFDTIRKLCRSYYKNSAPTLIAPAIRLPEYFSKKIVVGVTFPLAVPSTGSKG